MPRMPNSERFWRNTGQWAAEAKERPGTGAWLRAKAEALGVNLDQKTTTPRWRPRQRPPRPAFRGGAITVDPRLARDIGELMGKVAPRLQKAFDDHLAPLAGEVWAFWPVESRLSKAAVALEYGLRGGGRTFMGTIRLRAPYSLVIKGGPARKLLTSKERAVVDKIARDALDDIARGR